MHLISLRQHTNAPRPCTSTFGASPDILPVTGKQLFWDRPVIQGDRCGKPLELTLVQRATFLAASSHVQRGLAACIAYFILWIAAIRQRHKELLRLGLELCMHINVMCECVTQVAAIDLFAQRPLADQLGITSWRNLQLAFFPLQQFQTIQGIAGFMSVDGKYPDGVSYCLNLFPWQSGKSSRRVTVVCPLVNLQPQLHEDEQIHRSCRRSSVGRNSPASMSFVEKITNNRVTSGKQVFVPIRLFVLVQRFNSVQAVYSGSRIS